MDKWIAGLGGFLKGFMKLLTVPLDLLKDAISWVAGALGFEEFESMLDGFSFTEGFAEVVDTVVDFIQSIKDWVANKVKSLVNGVGEFFGLDPIFEDKPEAVSPPQQETPTAPAEPEVQRSYPVYSPEGELVSQAASPEEASQQAMKVGGYVGNPSVVAEGPTTPSEQVVATPTPEVADTTTNKRGATIGDSPAAAVKVKANGKRGATIGEAPAVAVKVKANGKRGATIGDTPTKVKIPEGVRVTPAGKYASYNNETNTQAFFSNVEDAVTFINAPIEQAAKMDPYAAKVYEEKKQSAPKRVLRSKSKGAEKQAPVLNAVGEQSVVSIDTAPSTLQESGSGDMIVGGSERVVMTEVMATERNKLDEKQAEVRGGGDTAIATTTNDNSTSIVNNKSNFVMPSATDKSDRTDRRGSFRGRAI